VWREFGSDPFDWSYRDFVKAGEYLSDCLVDADFWDTPKGQDILAWRAAIDLNYQKVMLAG
jgi:hypothetical protein